MDNNLAYADEKEEMSSNIVDLADMIATKRNKHILYRAVKRCFDVVCSLLGLVLLSPLFLIVAILIKREDGGPVIHTRYCVGKGGRTYKMFKFRSMVVDADNEDKYFTREQKEQFHCTQKVDNDPRITKTGGFLRASSIDELPQLISILKNDMSIIGPRPIVEDECMQYRDRREVEHLLQAKPGLTGLWQVSGRSDCTYESGERQRLELWYVDHRSITLDIRILLKTLAVVLGKAGAR